MSLHFLLDGYNIIKQTPSLNRGTLENQRNALLYWIKHSHPQGRNKITVVFDGKAEFFGAHLSGEVRAVFSTGQSADDLIKAMVEQSPSKKEWVVVSDDKDIKLYVRALGAAVLSVKEFIGTAARKASSSKASLGAQASKYITLAAQAKINQELERIWIKPQ